MTFNQIRYFITVAECLSFTEAAKCLFLTQPALSRQISAMEDEVGTLLFLREHKTLKFTPGGAFLYNRFRNIMKDYTEAIDDARTANQGYEGHLRIGFLDVYDISELFPEVLKQFKEKYPLISMTLECDSLGELITKLYDDKLDLILTYGFSLYDQPNLVTVNIQKFDSCIMLNAAHPLASKENLRLEDLAGERFAQLRNTICEEGHRFISSLLEKAGLHPEIMWADKMEDVLLWVQTNNAVAITSNRTTDKQNPLVVVRDLDMEEAKGHDITMAWRKNNYNPAIASFMEMAEGTFSHNPPRQRP